MKDRQKVIRLFGLWIRFYKGSTSKKKRIWKWKFDGIRGVNRGFTIRYRKESCFGIQVRKL